MGGYVCFPGGMMASLLGKPLVLVNADASLLLSNKALLPVADRVAFGFDGAAATKTQAAVVTGNPVRAEIEALPEPAERFAGRSGPLRLLVVGGSLGARVLNEMRAAGAGADRRRRSGRTVAAPDRRQADRRACAPPTRPPASRPRCCPSSTTWPQRLAECDLIVCRAGAITVSELCAAGVASVLVPLVVSTTSHQRDNAQFLAQHGARDRICRRRELTPAALADLLRGLDRDALLAMATKARALAPGRMPRRASADEIERRCEELARGAA